MFRITVVASNVKYIIKQKTLWFIFRGKCFTEKSWF